MPSGPCRYLFVCFFYAVFAVPIFCGEMPNVNAKPIEPLFRVVDLNVGETTEVTLEDGKKVRVKLLDLKEERCEIRDAVRRAVAVAEIDGTRVELSCATYHLPRTVGQTQVDCPVTRGYTVASSKANVWALEKDARLRLWPAGSPWIRPGTFGYPTDQRWFASDTQMGNEPCFVNACDVPGQKKVYYHYGLDFGGAEGLVTALSATDGVVISRAGELTAGDHPPTVGPRQDVVYVRDARGWYFRYSHLMSIDDGVKLGDRIKMGQPIGRLGKEGGSGGWAHLHFDVSMPQPSGKYGITDAYAFAFEAYRQQHGTKLIAVARPHLVTWTGDPVTLDGSRSWHAGGAERIERYAWRLSDGNETQGVTAQRTYEKPGHYTEVLTVTDDEGHAATDFAVVQVFDREKPLPIPPAIHAACWPTMGVGAGEEVTFKVRTFAVKPDEGRETWDFGDGSEPAQTQSDGNADHHAKDGYAVIKHRFAKPGAYVVTVQRTNGRGQTATARLHLVVDP